MTDEIGFGFIWHNLWSRNKKKICNMIKNQMCRYMTDGLSKHLRYMFLGLLLQSEDQEG